MHWNHSVQLFDTSDSLEDTVARFVLEGLDRSELVLVVTSFARWAKIDSRLLELKRRPAAALARGELVFVEKETVLNELLVNGTPDADQFEATVGTLIRRLAGGRKPLRVYGDMVDTLAGYGDLKGAQQLEALWNKLGASVPGVSLLCGYSAVHFANPKSTIDLRQICRQHTEVRTATVDDLGRWLVDIAQHRLPTSLHTD